MDKKITRNLPFTLSKITVDGLASGAVKTRNPDSLPHGKGVGIGLTHIQKLCNR